jgi:Zn finger protein HypA/HybF involved in hydrogenase expression
MEAKYKNKIGPRYHANFYNYCEWCDKKLNRKNKVYVALCAECRTQEPSLSYDDYVTIQKKVFYENE